MTQKCYPQVLGYKTCVLCFLKAQERLSPVSYQKEDYFLDILQRIKVKTTGELPGMVKEGVTQIDILIF